jgi:hypothetical protein
MEAFHISILAEYHYPVRNAGWQEIQVTRHPKKANESLLYPPTVAKMLSPRQKNPFGSA